MILAIDNGPYISIVHMVSSVYESKTGSKITYLGDLLVGSGSLALSPSQVKFRILVHPNSLWYWVI